MRVRDEFSVEEIEAIEALGGWEECRQCTDRILQEFGIHRSLLGEMSDQGNRQNASLIQGAFDPDKSITANLEVFFRRALELEEESGRTDIQETMLQHLIGAKLDLILGDGTIRHHGFSVADHSTERNADFEINGVAIHVTTHPGEALIRKVAANLKQGLRPLILTLEDGVKVARFNFKKTEWAARVDILDAAQFLTANVYERSLLQGGETGISMRRVIERYNEIIASCEVDPVLRIQLR